MTRDGRSWRLGRAAEVAWITEHTEPGRRIDAAIPAVFAGYATLVIPDPLEARAAFDHALIDVLRSFSSDQLWWLGYLETGASDIVFPSAPRVILYTGWPYVLVQAGPDQAASWRDLDGALPWHSALPELIFPADRSWLVSALWDDDWMCVGGTADLIRALASEPRLPARSVGLTEDATPPGHSAQ